MLQDILKPEQVYVQAYLMHFLGSPADDSTLVIYCPNSHILSNDRLSLEAKPSPSIVHPNYVAPFVVEYEFGKGNIVRSFDENSQNLQKAQGLVGELDSPTQLYLPQKVIIDMFKAGRKYNSDQAFFASAGKTMAPFLKPRYDHSFQAHARVFLQEAFDYLSGVEHKMSDADIPAPTETLDDVIMC